MTAEQLQKQEEEAFSSGSLSVLTQSVKNNIQVLISCRNKTLLGRVKASDRHWHIHMALGNMMEIWTAVPKSGKGKKKSKTVNDEDRCVSKMFLPGDWVIVGLRNPRIAGKQGLAPCLAPGLLAPGPLAVLCRHYSAIDRLVRDIGQRLASIVCKGPESKEISNASVATTPFCPCSTKAVGDNT